MKRNLYYLLLVAGVLVIPAAGFGEGQITVSQGQFQIPQKFVEDGDALFDHGYADFNNRQSPSNFLEQGERDVNAFFEVGNAPPTTIPGSGIGVQGDQNAVNSDNTNQEGVFGNTIEAPSGDTINLDFSGGHHHRGDALNF